MSQVGEPPGRWELQSDEAFDDRPLVLAEELTEALHALTVFAAQSPSADLLRQQPRYGEPPGAVRPPTALVALSVATAAVQSTMPPCPYAPAGAPVGIQYLPPNNKLVYRCGHINPAHCWDNFGHTPYRC
jgi:hypothetical protein